MEEIKIDYTKLNIYQKMALATEKIAPVVKKLQVAIGKSSAYKAVSEKDVLNAVKPVEYELGIYSYPYERKIAQTEVIETVKEYNGDKSISKQLFMRLEVTYRFINVDNPNEFIDVITYGDGVDSQDKAPGKAMTYADKYALLKAYKIETGDDIDKKPSAKLKGITKKQTVEEQLKHLELHKEFMNIVAKTDTDLQLILETYKVKDSLELSDTQLTQSIRQMSKKLETKEIF